MPGGPCSSLPRRGPCSAGIARSAHDAASSAPTQRTPRAARTYVRDRIRSSAWSMASPLTPHQTLKRGRRNQRAARAYASTAALTRALMSRGPATSARARDTSIACNVPNWPAGLTGQLREVGSSIGGMTRCAVLCSSACRHRIWLATTVRVPVGQCRGTVDMDV